MAKSLKNDLIKGLDNIAELDKARIAQNNLFYSFWGTACIVLAIACLTFRKEIMGLIIFLFVLFSGFKAISYFSLSLQWQTRFIKILNAKSILINTSNEEEMKEWLNEFDNYFKEPNLPISKFNKLGKWLKPKILFVILVIIFGLYLIIQIWK